MRVLADSIRLVLDENEAELIAYALQRAIVHSIETHWRRVGLAAWDKDHNAQKQLEMMRRLFQVIGHHSMAESYTKEFKDLITGGADEAN